MASRNIQVNLQFNANVQNAKAQLQSLQTQLNNLINANATGGKLGITPEIQTAVRSAMDLKIALNNAMNVNTGKLNLNKFEAELKRSGLTIQQLKAHMQRLGPQGVTAFNQMAQAVARADTRILSLSGGMKKLANTFMNTVRWQLTSQAIMAVTSAISETVDYAKKLDTSLNNIRIVTGKSADQMARFAKEANKAAKELSTTTTKYTDASLIYYQQGLNDRAVKERTDVTVKLANVVGEQAETVSEWMTAIWNNFDDGSESLEYYADVLAKLGAATASSADEIAGGLEKFAAVADTIGLSYEYAASALATITAETRQSEDVVGTALKTILSRMEQLKLGDVLDDGTTLGQYSLALQTVGVNIKDANGELKDMDIILQQTGQRWETLARDEQIALAQSVAGIRQYTQFMALMDNWDVMEKNLELTEKANGALAEQQRIYEESARAAEERLKTAKESIQYSLFGGDKLADLQNTGAEVLEIVGELIEAFGGLKGIILIASSALITMYQPQIATFFGNLGVNIKNMGIAAANAAGHMKDLVTHPIKTIKGQMPDRPNGQEQFRNSVIDAAVDINKSDDELPSTRIVSKDAEIQKTMMRDYANVNQNVKQRMEWEYEILQTEEQKVLKLQEEAKLSQEIADKKILDMQQSTSNAGKLQKQAAQFGSAEGSLAMATQLATQNQGLNPGTQAYAGLSEAVKSEVVEAQMQLDELRSSLPEELQPAIDNISFTDFLTELDKGDMKIEDMIAKLQELQSQLNGAADIVYTNTAEAGVSEGDTAAIQKNENMVKSIGNLTMMSDTGGVKTESDIASVSQDMATIDPNAITNKMGLEGYEQAKTALAELTEMQAKGQVGTEAYNKALGQLNKGLNKFTKNSKGTVKSLNSQNKKLNESKKKTKERTNALVKDTKALQNNEKKQKTSRKSLDSLSKSMDKFYKKLKQGPKQFTTFSDSLTAGIQVFASFASGLTMVESGMSSMFDAFNEGEFSLSSLLSGFTSLSFGILQVLSSISNLNKNFGAMPGTIKEATAALDENKTTIEEATTAEEANATASEASVAASEGEVAAENAEAAATEGSTTAQTAENAVDAAEVAGTPAQVAASNEEAAGEAVEQGANIVTATTGIAKQAGQGPTGWITAAISAAMVAALLGSAIAGAVSSSSASAKEAKQEEVSKGTETIEAINENQELAGSVEDLTEEYNALRNAGESTADVLEDMREKIPELIDSYKELAKTIGMPIDTSALEDAYQNFLTTGDTTAYEAAQKEIDDKIAGKQKSTAGTTLEKATDLMIEAATEGSGWTGSSEYNIDLGEPDKVANQILSDVFGDNWDGDNVEFNFSDPGEVLSYYENAIKARDKLKEAGLENTAAYERLNEDIKQMSGYVEDAYTAQEAQFNIIKEELLAAEKEGLDKIKLSDGTTGDQIQNLKEYETYRQQLIDSLVKEHDMTEAQAISYLKATNALGQYEDAITTFGTAEERTARANTITQYFGEQGLEQVKEFYEGLSKEDRTLFLSIDFSTIESLSNLDQAMQELRDKAAEAKILQEVTKLEVDEAVFETYTEGLAEINAGLEKNSVLTKQIALNNLKISKGLETLTKSWDDNFEIMSRANKASLEYAEAVGEIKKALEEMFGVQPSTDYIETYKNELNEMVNGNLESLETLQDALAEDYILNMEFKQATNNEWTGTIANAQEQLRGLLDDIDTSVEVGKESTLSSDYLNSVQNMLDAGVIAEEQLEDLFRAKGYELNITGWKKMPGPKTTMVRTVYDGETGDKKYTEKIEQGEEISVPIINGQTDGLEVSGTPSTATVTKSTDKRVIDTSGAEERNKKKEDRIKSLNKEKDRYHEINEIISDTERELDKLGKAKDRAYGASKLALLNREIEKQKELIENNKELLKQAEDNIEIDKKNLIKNTSSAYTLEFDEYGRIANYEDIEDAYIKKLKANAGNTTKYEKLEEEFEEWKEAASQYEETLNKVEEQSEKVNDELDALYEKSLEKIEYKVELRVEIADDDKAYIDFMMQKLEDDAFAAADKIGLLGKEAENTLEKIAANQQGIADIEAAVANGEITPAQAVEKLREFRDEIIDLNADLQELRQTVQDSLTEAFEAWNEKIEEGISSLEFYGSVLSGYKNIIDIVGKDMLGLSDETMTKLNKAIISNTNDTIRATKAQLDANKATLAKMQEARQKALEDGDEEAVKAWDEQIKAVTEKSQELTTTLQDALATGLQAAADAFGDQVNQIADDFSKAVSGIYDSIFDMRENWDRMGEVADRFLKTYEQAYQINKLNRQIEQSINSTDSVKAQRELKSLQSEMFNMTKDNQQMSKYDLEYLQKRYNLLLAEQALKDAQNAKSSARLVKDSSGNFGYVYTADQKNIDSAQQKYEDEAYAYQQYVDNMDQELTEMYISAQERMEERIREAAEKYGEGTEEFKAAQKQIIEEYKQDIEYITNEYGKITERNLDINQRFSLGIADSYEETFLGSILPNYENFAALYDGTTQIAEDACTRLNEAIVDLRNTFKDQFDLAGEDVGSLADIANEKFGDIAQDSSDTADAVETMALDMDTALNGEGGAIDAVSTFYTEYSKKMEDVRDETGKTIGKVKDLITEYQNLIDKAVEANGIKPPETAKGEDKVGNTNTNNGRPPVSKYHVGNTVNASWEARHINVLNREITEANYNKEKKTWEYKLKDNGNWIPEKYLWESSPSLNAPVVEESKPDPKPHMVEADHISSASKNDKEYYKLQWFKDAYKDKIIEVDGVEYVQSNDSEYYYKIDDTKKIKKVSERGYSVTHEIYQIGSGLQAYNLEYYDTGGYTGSWGPEGRMAMLHQKEIVLNAHDTENFLTAIEIVRSIATQLENNALRTAQGLGSLVAAAAVNSNREVLEQNVTIHAEFPNATDHNEIELAFNDLINQASQYVNRR